MSKNKGLADSSKRAVMRRLYQIGRRRASETWFFVIGNGVAGNAFKPSIEARLSGA